jgi:ribulose-5-phosphate 4-epimerase/fuculose-1-phosphate aldolase
MADLGQSLEYAWVSVILSDSIGHGILCFGYTALSAAVAASQTFRKLCQIESIVDSTGG